MSPGQYNWDMSIAKLIKIRESKTLELRGEFFNTFNHPQFSFNPVDDPALSAQDAGGSTFGQVTRQFRESAADSARGEVLVLGRKLKQAASSQL